MYVRIPDLVDHRALEQATGFTRVLYWFFPPKDRKNYTQFQVMEEARRVLAEYPDVRASVSSGNLIGGQVQYDIEMILTGPSTEKLSDYSDMILEQVHKIDGLVDVDTTLPQRKPELRLMIDRAKASELGVNIREVASTLQTMVGGEIVSDFKDESTGEQYDVWLRAQEPFRDSKTAIENLNIWSSKAGMVKIASIADLIETRPDVTADAAAAVELALGHDLQALVVESAATLPAREELANLTDGRFRICRIRAEDGSPGWPFPLRIALVGPDQAIEL